MDHVAENEAPEAAPPLGALLVEGREHQGLTRNDVAQRLHMSPSQVEAIESGEYGRLPKGPFLRGFVRNYAKLIGLDPESVLPLLADGMPRDPAPRIVVPTQNIRFDPLGERFSGPWMKAAAAALVVIVVALVGTYWWLFMRPQAPVQQASQAALPAQSASAAAPAQPPAASANEPAAVSNPPVASSDNTALSDAVAAQAAPAPTAGPPATAQQQAPLPEASAAVAAPVPALATSAAPAAATPAQPGSAAPVKPTPPGQRRLHFRFKGESWVEVRDVAGRVVFRTLNAPGSEAYATGKPPLQVIVGNAAAVAVERDGRPFDMAPVTDTGVARFKVE